MGEILRSEPGGASRAAAPKRIVLSVNASWNIVNFRLGLIRGLQEAGHTIVVVAPEDAYTAQFEEHGISYEPIRLDPKGMSPWRDLALLVSYWKLFRRIRPDVYLGYTVKPNIYGSIAAHALGIPVINNIAGLGSVFTKDTAITRLVSFLYRLACAKSKTIFFQNQDDRDLFVARKLVKAERVALLPGSGVDLARFYPSRSRGGRERFKFLLIARMLWDKGIGDFVDAARRLRREIPSVSCQLLGFLDLQGRNAVPRRTVEKWVEEGIVEYLGEADDVRPYLLEADCVVLPSRYREGVPRSLLEAAAMATPLIATNTPGCRDIVQHGVNGLLCKVGDASSLFDAMLEMVNYSDQRRLEMGQAGRALVEDRFSEAIVVRAYLDAIDRA
jgi:glycosyltransferase involved in cell wall biosynthesis